MNNLCGVQSPDISKEFRRNVTNTEFKNASLSFLAPTTAFTAYLDRVSYDLTLLCDTNRKIV